MVSRGKNLSSTNPSPFTSAVGSADQQAVGLLHFARLDKVPDHTVRLKRQLSRGADDYTCRTIAMRPLNFVEQLRGRPGFSKQKSRERELA